MTESLFSKLESYFTDKNRLPHKKYNDKVIHTPYCYISRETHLRNAKLFDHKLFKQENPASSLPSFISLFDICIFSGDFKALMRLLKKTDKLYVEAFKVSVSSFLVFMLVTKQESVSVIFVAVPIFQAPNKALALDSYIMRREEQQ